MTQLQPARSALEPDSSARDAPPVARTSRRGGWRRITDDADQRSVDDRLVLTPRPSVVLRRRLSSRHREAREKQVPPKVATGGPRATPKGSMVDFYTSTCEMENQGEPLFIYLFVKFGTQQNGCSTKHPLYK
nr:unnamed protein product [Callosobruchus chinensis]